MAFVVLLSLAPTVVYGQVSAGTVQGTVEDPSGAVVAGATVTIVNDETQLKRSETTSASGLFAFNSVPIGPYKLTVQAKGFANYSENIQVSVGSRLDRAISLTVGGAATTIEVVGADVAAVNTINQEVSSVVNATEMSQLPTLTRNPYDLVATAGNAQQDSQAGEGDGRGAGYSLNGQRSASTSIMLDGAENVDLFDATVGQTVPQDSVQEFRVISNGMTSEYGRASGGVVNVATKSGTNAFHGSAYEFNRVAALASNTYYNAANDITKAGFTRNQFGYSIGGPVKKNKLFFFNNTEWIRVRSSAAAYSMVANPAFIAAADTNTQSFFSTYGNLRPDLKTLGSVTVGDLYNNLVDNGGTPGPLLTALNTASPGMAAFDKVTYNVPQDAGGGTPENTLMTVARVDFNMSDKTQLFGRYSYYSENDFAGSVNTSPYVGYETGQTNKDNNFLLSLTHSFTANVLSSTRVVFTRLNGPVQPLGAAAVGPTLYMSNSYTGRVGNTTLGSANVGFPGYNEYTPGNSIPFGGPQNLIQLYQDLSWVHGKHTFRFGGQYIYTQDNRVFGAYESAVESLGATQSDSYEGFLSGTLNAFQAAVNPQGKYPCLYDSTGAEIVTADCTVNLPVSAPSFSRSNIYNDLAFYGQDSWKLTRRLTVNLGLRWEYYGVQHNKNPKLDSNFYYGSGSDIFDQLRNGSVQIAPQSPVGGLWAPQKHNFGPRIGFAYDIFGDGKTSLRGGFGIAYERNFGNVTYNVIQNPPAYAVLSITPTDIGGPIAVTTENAGPLAGSSGSKALGRVSLRHVSQDIKTAYTEQWNLGLEHEVRPNLVASLSYDGARGIHQYSISNINESGFAQAYLGDTSFLNGPGNYRLNTQYSNINNRGSAGDSYYDALVAELHGKVKKVQFGASYTWSHSIDTLSSTFSDEVVNNGLGYLDPFNPGLDKGNSDYDARHRLSVSAVVPLPFYENSSNKILQNTVGGWQFTPIFTVRSGYPFTVFDCSNSHSPYNCPRADITAGAIAPRSASMSADTGGDWFNYLTVPAAVGEYSGPEYVTGTTTPFPFAASNIPTCTGLYHQGCSFPSNMQGRNYYVAPGNWNLIFGVSKGFTVTERVKMQFRAEFFDLTNHKNFYIVGYPFGGADVSSSTTINAMKGGYGNPFDDHRNIQLALRLTF